MSTQLRFVTIAFVTCALLLLVAAAVIAASHHDAAPLRHAKHKQRRATPPRNPCHGKENLYPYCFTNISIDERVDDIVSRLSLGDIALLYGNTQAPIKTASGDVDLPANQVWSEALHGVAHSPGVHFGGDMPCATSLPAPSMAGASFDKDLFDEMGEVIGREVRAAANIGHSGISLYSNLMTCNTYPSATWGRSPETTGNSPMLQSIYAARAARAVQNNSRAAVYDPTRLRVIGMVKHFVAYALENWGGASRHSFDAKVSQHDLLKFFTPPFETAVHPGGGAVAGVMCSYNAVNGVPSCAHGDLINGLLRTHARANMYVSSDCGAVGNMFQTKAQGGHGYVKTPEEAINASLSAGMQIDCGSALTLYLEKAVNESVVSEKLARDGIKPWFAQMFRSGYFDPVAAQPYRTLGAKDINTPEAQRTAYKAAAESIVLLDRQRPSHFPLDPSKHKHILVVGPMANATGTMQGPYYGKACFLTSPLDGLKRYATQVSHAQGCTLDTYDALELDAAVAMVGSGVDAVVMLGGINEHIEHEGQDRVDLGLPGQQNLLFRKVAAAAHKADIPVIAAFTSGQSIDVSHVMRSKPSAMLWWGYAGQSGGQALADVIYGKVAPSGRLNAEWYFNSYVAEMTAFDYSLEANPALDYPGRSHLYYSKPFLFPFAHGLSLSTWAVELDHFSRVAIPADRRSLPDTLNPIASVMLRVTNTGSVASKWSLVLWLERVGAEAAAGSKPLADFAKTQMLKPGESQVLTLQIALYSVLAFPSRTVAAGDYRWGVKDTQLSGVIAVPA